jgi:hypothetical protein
VGLTTLPCKKKIVEKPLRNSAGFCGGGQGLSWAVGPREEERSGNSQRGRRLIPFAPQCHVLLCTWIIIAAVCLYVRKCDELTTYPIWRLSTSQKDTQLCLCSVFYLPQLVKFLLNPSETDENILVQVIKFWFFELLKEKMDMEI